MSQSQIIAYMTSQYARASDTFVRGKVRELRALGFDVRTFSIRKPDAREVVSEEIRAERERTEYVLTRENIGAIGRATLRSLWRTPGKFAAMARLALRCAGPGIPAKAKSFAYMAEACYLAERIRAIGATRLHNQFAEGDAIVAMLIGLLNDIPYSLTIHGPGEFDHPETLARDEKIGRSAFTVTVSDWGRSQILRWIRLADWPKVRIVHCGVGQAFLDAPPSPVSSERRLVSVGRLVAEKGYITLIEAARDLAAEGLDFQLAIVGDGPMRGEMERLIAQHRLAKHVLMLGWLSSMQVHREIQRARAFVLPSFAENLPVALMEAGALHRPVITTYIGGIPELFRDGVHGWLVPASSASALKEAMREALTAPAHRLAAMGQAAATAVGQNHDPRVEARKLASLLDPAAFPEALPQSATPIRISA